VGDAGVDVEVSLVKRLTTPDGDEKPYTELGEGNKLTSHDAA
jgi:hypothetical protein